MKSFSQKYFCQEKYLAKIFLSRKIFGKNIFVTKKYLTKIFLDPIGSLVSSVLVVSGLVGSQT